MAHPGRQALLKVVAARPGVCLKDLADELGMSMSSISWHHQMLDSIGLLESRRDGTHRRFFLGPLANQWLRQFQGR